MSSWDLDSKFKQLEQRWSRPVLAQAANSTKKMKLEPTSRSVAASLRDATGKESLTHKPYSEVGEPIHFRSDT
jgi:hypothetical protein